MTSQGSASGRTEQGKSIVVAGCPVTLTFHEHPGSRWSVQGTVSCGLGHHRRDSPFHTALYPTRDEAERAALERAAALLGHNVPAGQ